MDFARINPRRDAETPATYHVEFDGERLYNKAKKAVTIDFLGLESETGRRAAARMVKALDQKSGKKRNAKSMGVDEIIDAASESEAARAKFYADVTVGWANIDYIDDKDLDNPDAKAKPLEYSKENAVMLFTTRPWIMEGIDAFLGDKTNFSRTVGDS